GAAHRGGPDGPARQGRVGRGACADHGEHPSLRPHGRARRALRQLQGAPLMTRDVAVVSFAELPAVRREWERDEVEMLVPVIAEAVERSGIPRREIGFTVSGSSDFLTGRPFSFVIALDAAGAWPPIEESHVEMDGAFALYEAWVRLQHGDIDSALIYA